ncbi:hypothetical protein ANME2D_02357 [Candidatus Methanoperedens nitroreducens]|uniref:Uncharacterized protein n=1 Tax=Candidatus Methanoperedens nitratireducens TaxID=1392998 RepID=A0A062V2M5_9EURY|nr:hypothetical protein [Candidatus Methanoperedens nitroreducens]KCZ71622.1 hypothetical protein ANME2D_02357 [Candidatus Methanoperedens nitroreducens]MDJ1421252.1 hypothetical protein [Candidatus Methanoperedens sp.]
MVFYCNVDGCGAISQSQAESTIKLLGNPFCPKHAGEEMAKSAEQLVPVKVKVRRKLEQEGYEQHGGNQNLYTKGNFPHKRFVDITRLPVSFEIGILRPDGERVTEGHGITELEGLKQEIEALLKSKNGAGKNGKKETQPAPQEQHEEKHTEEKKAEDKAAKGHEATAAEPEKPKPGVETYPMPHERPEGAEPFVKKQATEIAPRVFKNQLPTTTNPFKPDARLPVRTYTPQGSMIKGFIPQLKEIGKIKIGRKGAMKESSGGKQFRLPEKFDHFEVVSVLRDEKGDFIPDQIMQALGENPKSLDIMLLYNDPTLNFVTRYNYYRGGKCLCQGDGQQAKNIDGDTIECNPDACQDFQQKKCKPNGILSAILTQSPRLGGVYKFRTTSYNSIKSILSSLFFLRSLTGGVLAMIPLKLTVSPMTVQPKDSPTTQTIYVVNVEFDGTAQQLLQTTVEVSKYQGAMRAQIIELENTARLALAAPESEMEIRDIEAEYYPETAAKEAI